LGSSKNKGATFSKKELFLEIEKDNLCIETLEASSFNSQIIANGSKISSYKVCNDGRLRIQWV